MRLTWMELLIKGIPEGFLDIFAMYILTKAKFDIKKYILISLLFIISVYLIRMLPIIIGVNLLVSLILLVFLFVLFNNVEISKAIKSTIIVMVVILLSECINIFLLITIFGDTRAQEFFNVPSLKAITGIPSTLLFGIFVLVLYFIKKDKVQ